MTFQFQNGRTMHERDTVSIAEGLSILNSAETAVYKYTQLDALHPSVLLELCLARGINTAQFTLAPHSTYPRHQQMIPALITSPAVSHRYPGCHFILMTSTIKAEAIQTPDLSLVVLEWIASHKPATQKTIKKLKVSYEAPVAPYANHV
jgi:hypothetical protein